MLKSAFAWFVLLFGLVASTGLVGCTQADEGQLQQEKTPEEEQEYLDDYQKEMEEQMKKQGKNFPSEE